MKRRTLRLLVLVFAATAVAFAFEGRRRALDRNGDPARREHLT
ncbi:MAG: hypothetical protein R3A49_02150 [Acidimicrobiia bacterium]